MTILYRLRALVRWLFRRDEIERALNSDLEDYIERSAAEKMRAGMTETEAQRAARIELGGVEQTKDRVRETLSLGFIETFIADLGYALRTLCRRKTFTIVSVLTLALGIGATAAVFSVVHSVLLKPPPYAHPDRVVRIVENIPAPPGLGGPIRASVVKIAELDDWRQAKTLSHVALIVGPQGRVLTTDDRTVQLYGSAVSPDLFTIRGVQPLLGRGLLPEEERADADVIVLGEGAWREQFGADPGIVGRRVTLDGQPLTVVGVMPHEFGPEAFWTPFSVPPAGPGPSFAANNYANSSALLSDGVSIEAAAAEINAIGLALRGATPEPAAPPRFEVVRGLDEVTARVVPALRVFVAAVVAVLLIVCTNIANLLLARGTQRQQEIAIRRSLGATRGRIVRLVLAESMTLAAIAGVIGLVLAFGAVKWLKSASIADLPRRFQLGASILPRVDELSIDPVVLLFVAGLVVVAGALFGILPALRLARYSEKGHGAASQLSTTAGNARLGHMLGTAQLAGAMSLLIAAALLLNSFLRLTAVDAGFNARGVLSFELVVPRDATAERKTEVARALANRLRADPRVTAAGFTNIPPLTGTGLWIMANFVPEGMSTAEVREAENALGGTQRTGTRTVSSGYLHAIGARLVEGTWLPERPNPADFEVLVSRAYAQRYFPERSAVGQTLISGSSTATIVGIVDDVHLGSLESAPESIVYMEPSQALPVQRAYLGDGNEPGYFDRIFLTQGGNVIAFAARTDGDPLALVADLRGIARSIDPTLAIDATIPMDAVLSGVTTRPRFYAFLLSGFGVIAAFVAVIGIYGVLAYLVSQRTREIGIRMALGAQRKKVLELVLRRGLTMVAIGITAGVLGALGLTRYLAGMLYGITALDPETYIVVAVAFSAVALLASYLPVRRATRVDPVTVLRYE